MTQYNLIYVTNYEHLLTVNKVMDENIIKQSSAIRNDLSELCNKVLDCTRKDGFPKDDDSLATTMKSLKNDVYDVVVCGEVKKGKSSLINAILGEDLLPVDTRVATSQAFRIINDESRAFYLVHTDGTKKAIKKEDLDKYGSQVRIDKDGEMIEFDKIVDYMEVHVPIPFLPKSIVLVDTPGLGAIYANHALVTMRHLAKSSAVIFVMDPANPLTDAEIGFLEKITDITSNVLLVMTKQDNYNESYISTMIARNIEILGKKGFKERFDKGKIEILPMSSLCLRTVSDEGLEQEERNIFYEVSCFEKVKAELLNMIESTIALSKNVATFNALNGYNTRVMSAVAEIDAVLKSPDEGKQLLVRKQHVKANFQAKWGVNGSEQKAIVAEVNALVGAFSTKATALFNPGSELYNKLLSEIECISSYDEAKSYAETFPNRMMTEYMQAWQALNEDCASRIANVLSKFQEKAVMEWNKELRGGLSKDVTLPPYKLPEYGLMDKFNFTKGGWFTLFFVASVFNVGLTLAALPIAFIIGWFTGNNAKMNQIKMKLRDYLNQNLATLHYQVFVNPMDANDTLSVTLFESTKAKHLQVAQDALKHIYDERLSVVEAEVKSLNDQIAAIGVKRSEMVRQLQTMKDMWNPIYTKLGVIREEFAKLEKTIAAKNVAV